MIKYIELHRADNGSRVLFKADAIRDVDEDYTEDKHNGEGPVQCRVNGLEVRETYEQVKRLLKQDPRRVYVDDEVHPRLKQLLMLGLLDVVKADPGDWGRQAIVRLLTAETDEQAYGIEREVYDRVERTTRGDSCDLRTHSRRGGDDRDAEPGGGGSGD